MTTKLNKKRKITETDEFWIQYGIDMSNRTVMLDEEVDEYSIGWIIRAVLRMEEADNETPIKIYVNTYGGSCYDGLGLYDVLVNCDSPIHTYGIGKVMSMGTWIMLAGDEKYCYANTTFMWHSISDSGTDGKTFEHVINMDEIKRLQGRLFSIYGNRSNKTVTWWKKWIEYKDRYGDAEMAIELGFVDEIVGV